MKKSKIPVSWSLLFFALNCDVGDIMEFVPDSCAEGSNHQTGITTEQKAEKSITYENFTYHGEKRSNGEQ